MAPQQGAPSTKLPALAIQLREPLAGETGGGGIAKTLYDLVERRARLAPVLQLVIAVADLEQRIRNLAGLRILLDHGPEIAQRVRILFGDVVRFTEPVLRVVGQRAVRERRQ